MILRVCIPTAGVGSRLGPLAENLNKSLISINNKPTISHQIDYFPDNTEFVIPLGYKGNSVREFLLMAYPKKKFFFKKVSDFTSSKSGLGLSILECKKHLNRPFIFLSCDTLLKGKIPDLSQNWIGCADNIKDMKSYRTISANRFLVSSINEKGSKRRNILPYIGLCGIKDHDLFWKSMMNGGAEAIRIGESYGLKYLIKKDIHVKKFKWFDTGNIHELKRTRKIFNKRKSPVILEKKNEAIWFVENNVIKYSNDKKFIKDRIKRSINLKKYVPKIIESSQNMYKYSLVEGEILSSIVNVRIFKKFLKYSNTFWKKSKLSKIEFNKFKVICNNFYKEKTYSRLDDFYKNFNYKDNNTIINNSSVPRLEVLLDKINWKELEEGIPGRFHGDFHFENIVFNQNSFTFLDWRQNFGGLLEYGDIYYDFAKLLHGMIINHEVISNNLYSSHWNKNKIFFKFERKKNLVECEKYFYQWLKNKNYNVKKVRILSALIFLNIAALHHYPYCILLYGLGKKMIFDEINYQMN